MHRIPRAMSAEFVFSRYFVDRRSDFHAKRRVQFPQFFILIGGKPACLPWRRISISLVHKCTGRNDRDQVVSVNRKKAIVFSLLKCNIFIHNFQIGLYFFPPRLTGDIYENFIENELPILLEDVPLRVRTRLIFQHDGAPTHFYCQVRDMLNTYYPNRWIGRGGSITWPVRSPDLNVLDFFVWGYKNKKSNRAAA